MEFVLTFLAVILLVVLPVLFLILTIWGLFYSTFRALGGERGRDAHAADQGAPPEASRETGTPNGAASARRVLK